MSHFFIYFLISNKYNTQTNTYNTIYKLFKLQPISLSNQCLSWIFSYWVLQRKVTLRLAVLSNLCLVNHLIHMKEKNWSEVFSSRLWMVNKGIQISWMKIFTWNNILMKIFVWNSWSINLSTSLSFHVFLYQFMFTCCLAHLLWYIDGVGLVDMWENLCD